MAIASKFAASYALLAWAGADVVHLFNAPGLNWLGWITQKPVTEDYVPLFPWLGVMWWGVAAWTCVLRERAHWLALSLPAPLRSMAWLGRWSLSYYMLHQPVLLGLLAGVAWFARP